VARERAEARTTNRTGARRKADGGITTGGFFEYADRTSICQARREEEKVVEQFSGFGYVFASQHTYVTLLRGPEGECVELNEARSRTVPNLFSMDSPGNYVAWTLVREVESKLQTASRAGQA
jgi:hypothetical protein